MTRAWHVILGFVATPNFKSTDGTLVWNAQVVTSLADPAANIIFGAVVDDKYTGEIHVTIVATGFSQTFQKSIIDPKAAKQEVEEAKPLDTNWKRAPPASVKPAQGLGRKGFF